MKRFPLLIINLLIVSLSSAQVSIKTPALQGYEARIKEFVCQMRVTDTHEHLINPEGIRNSGMCDFTLLLHHYADDDIKSAGMGKREFEKVLTDSMTVMEKWDAIRPFWEGSFNTAYNRAVSLAADSLFGIKNIDGTTVSELSAKIRQAYSSDWMNHILTDRCRLDYVVVDGDDRSFGDPDIFRYVKKFDCITIKSAKDIRNIEQRHKTEIRKPDDLVRALEKDFMAAIEKGIVAVKITVAYSRTLYFEDVSREKAARALYKILRAGDNEQTESASVKSLQDFMTYRLVELAGIYDIPVQIHTGLQAGDGNLIENSNPSLLASMFLKYRDVKFILFHGGYPFGGELATLAKNFRNVYIDMCWLYIISPSYSSRYLHEWLETVPANKIMAFGGDFHNAEGVYGHLLLARQVIANVLTEKVRDSYFTEDEAIRTAEMLLHDNAIRILKLSRK